MSDTQFFRLVHSQARMDASRACLDAPQGYLVTIRPQTRTLAQNALLWPLLTDLSRQVEWHGQKMTPEEWKIMLTASLKAQKVVPAIDGGFVVLGQSTSKMSVKEMSDLVELIHAFGAQHDVRFSA